MVVTPSCSADSKRHGITSSCSADSKPHALKGLKNVSSICNSGTVNAVHSQYTRICDIDLEQRLDLTNDISATSQKIWCPRWTYYFQENLAMKVQHSEIDFEHIQR